MKKNNPHYKLIVQFYGSRRAARSHVPYINHINEGLAVLDAIGATLRAKEGYCIHPVVQDDRAIRIAFRTSSILWNYAIHPYSLALALEYRSVANEYLSYRSISSIAEIRLSPLKEVQQMLIADKVQNRKDFEQFHSRTHPRAEHLRRYFKQWLRRLKISERRYKELESLIC
jgi:hypothetical protein